MIGRNGQIQILTPENVMNMTHWKSESSQLPALKDSVTLVVQN